VSLVRFRLRERAGERCPKGRREEERGRREAQKTVFSCSGCTGWPFDRSREITGISAGIGICIVAIKPPSDTLWRNYRIAADVFVISRSRSVPPVPGCPVFISRARLPCFSPSAAPTGEKELEAAEPSIYAHLAFPWRELFLKTRLFDPPPTKLRFVPLLFQQTCSDARTRC